MSNFLLQNGITLAIALGIVGLVVAFGLIAFVRGCATGNDKMREVAEAIREGAKAYLRRQVVTISAIALVLFFVIWWLRDINVAMGFVLGAVCSLMAGYI